MPLPSKPDIKAKPALSEHECKALFEFLRVSDGAMGSAAAVEERLLTSLALAYRRQLISN